MNRDHFIGAMAAVLAFIATAIVAIALVTPTPKVHPAPLEPAPIVQVQSAPLSAPVPLPRHRPVSLSSGKSAHINQHLVRPHKPAQPGCIMPPPLFFLPPCP